jgi:hypothetical protein
MATGPAIQFDYQPQIRGVASREFLPDLPSAELFEQLLRRSSMSQSLTKNLVSRPRQRLIELMQSVNFGRLEHVRVADGEPRLPSLTHVIREVKFGGENGIRPESQCSDFTLKGPVVEMLQYFDRLGNCHIDVLEIKHGLPFRMLVREEVA